MTTIPTLLELYTSIINSLEAEFDATINEDGKSELSAQASVLAGKLKQFYLAIGELQKNIWPDTCDTETLYRFGTVRLGRLPFPAVAGQYSVTVTGTNGAVIPALSIFKSDDSAFNPGVLYILDTAFTFTGTSGTITLRALTLGLDGKLNISDTLTATAPIAQVNSGAVVTAQTIQPLAGETIDEYRQKVLDSFRREAQGGSATDYRLWSADAQGVAKVYPYATYGAPSQIDLYIEATEADSIDGKGTPTATIISDVESVVNFSPDTILSLNQRGRRPLQVIVNYKPITPRTIIITITGYEGLDATIQAQLLSAFTDAIALIRPYVAAAEPIALKNDIIDINKLVGVIISAKPGAIFTSVSFKVDGVSLSTYTFQLGDIPYLNPTIIYI